jgi:hypothetical protein
MNCPQCQTANGPQSAFCGNCGAQLTVAQAAAPAGYPPPQGTSTPPGYAASGAPTGYGPPPGYDAPGGNNSDETRQSPSYSPGQYPPGQYQPGQYQPPGQYQAPAGGPQAPRPSSLPPVNFDHSRLDRVDKIVAGATFITMISIWLPWYSLSDGPFGTFRASGTAGHGWLWLEFIVAIVLIAYLTARAAWDNLPFSLPVAHAPLLIVGTSLQLLLVLIAFIDIPYGGSGVGWSWGAFIGLLAALVAAGPVVVPAVRSWRASRNGGSAPRSY